MRTNPNLFIIFSLRWFLYWRKADCFALSVARKAGDLEIECVLLASQKEVAEILLIPKRPCARDDAAHFFGSRRARVGCEALSLGFELRPA